MLLKFQLKFKVQLRMRLFTINSSLLLIIMFYLIKHIFLINLIIVYCQTYLTSFNKSEKYFQLGHSRLNIFSPF